MGRTIILVDLCWGRDKDPRLPLGHASLHASLACVPNVWVRSVVVPVNGGSRAAEQAVERVLSHADGLPHDQVDVALGAYVWAEHILVGLLSTLRDRGFTGRIILGGPQVSHCGAGLEQHYPEADVFIRGYGELALVRLAATPERICIPGVHWAGQTDQGGQASVNLAELPSPWLEGILPLPGQDFVRWETQRGCPFRCAFCQHREAGEHLSRRSFGLERLYAEVDLFCRHGVQEIAVLDPIFNASHHASALLRRLTDQGFRGRLSLQCRAEMVDEAFLKAAAALNVQLEFGIQTVIPGEGRAVRRLANMEKVDRTLRAVRRLNIDHEASLIFGLPLQTLASFGESVCWCLSRRVQVIKAFPLLLLRGTTLDMERSKWGLVDGGGPMPMVVESTTFSHQEWLAMARLAQALSMTEGQHPATLEHLQALAVDLDPALFRYQPNTKEVAA